MELRFASQIRKGNNKGTGFTYLPKDKIKLFNLGDVVSVRLSKDKFFAKIISYSHRLGLYIPRYIAIRNNLINAKVEIRLKKVDGFYAKMYSDGRVYIPKDIIENQKLKNNDIVLIKGIEDGITVREKFSRVHIIKRKNRSSEYLCIFDKIFYKKRLLFRIEKRSQGNRKDLNQIAVQLLKDMHYAFVAEDSVIVFKGNKVPVILNTKIEYPDIAFYLGAYFADGTKKGNSWAICASTFEQARYYLKMHNLLIKDSEPEFTISYTNINNLNNEKIKRRLAEMWEEKTGIKIDKLRIRKPSGELNGKWNKYGTLVIKEHKQILLDLYNALLEFLIKEILSKRDKQLALNFICGVMEGDGYAAANPVGSIKIWTNKKDLPLLKNVFEVIEIKYKTSKHDFNKYSLDVGALEILRNFHFLKDKIFVLYPKRRKTLLERLKTVGAVKFLTENHKSTNWVKAWLKDNSFCNRNYKITDKGLRLGNDLIIAMNKSAV